MSTYENYAAGKPPIERPNAQTMEELQAQIDGFLRKHPIKEDPAMTARIDRILLERKLKKR
jgi:hypothetical protein